MVIRFTSFANAGQQPLSKTFTPRPDGSLEKKAAAQMSAGYFETHKIADLDDFAAMLATLKERPDIAFAYGICRHAVKGEIVTSRAARRHKRPGAWARERENFDWPAGAGLLFLDIDVDGEAAEIDTMLAGAVPEIGKAKRLYLPSASAGIIRSDGIPVGSRKWHLYMTVPEARAIPTIGTTIAIELARHGHARIFISESGTRYCRTAIDTAVWQPERLDFVGPPILSEGLRRHAAAVLFDGTAMLDAAALLTRCAPISPSFELWARADNAMRALNDAAAPEAMAMRARWAAVHGKKLKMKGISRERAEQITGAAPGGVLYSDFLLQDWDGREFFIADALRDPAGWDGCTIKDPLESGYNGGATVGKLFLDQEDPVAFSQAHGGASYRLEWSPEAIFRGEGWHRRIAAPVIPPGCSAVPVNSRGVSIPGTAPKAYVNPIKLPTGAIAEIPDDPEPGDDDSFPTTRCHLTGERRGLRYYTEPGRGRLICPPLRVIARSLSIEGSGAGHLIAFRPPRTRDWELMTIPAAALQEARIESTRKLLADRGCEVQPDMWRPLAAYIMNSPSELIVKTAPTVGWHNGYFVFPDYVVGLPVNTGPIYTGAAQAQGFGIGGTLRDWRETICRAAVHNPWIALAVAVALAGPLLRPAGCMNTGLHFFGRSSCGKTTLLHAAASVWGPAREFVETWRATSNALEAQAEARNDTCIVLDEISECRPEEVQATAYMLGNGLGKGRANRKGDGRPRRRFSGTFLSSGERDVRTHAGREINVGQSVRMTDVYVHDAFPQTGGLGGAVFSRWLREAVAQHYGHPGREFVRLIAENAITREQIRTAHEEERAAGWQGDAASGRVAENFALYRAAARLAEGAGIVLPGFAASVAQACGLALAGWSEAMEGRTSEDDQIEHALRTWLDANEAKALIPANDSFELGPGGNPADIASLTGPRGQWAGGWYEPRGDGGRIYYLNAKGFEAAIEGHSKAVADRVLLARGILRRHPRSGGASWVKKFQGVSRRVRILEWPAEADEV